MESTFEKNKLPDYTGCVKQIAFIVGTGRCGTTILARVLNSHSRICIPHELQIIVSIGNGDRLYDKYISGEFENYAADDFIRLINECCPYYFEKFFDYIQHFKNLRYPQPDIRIVLKDLFDHICFEYKKDVFMEQTPWYGQKLGILKELFPAMKVIHMIRDGRDVALSFARTPWWSSNVDDNILQWQREIEPIHNFILDNRENCIEIRYEDLVLNPKLELKKILQLFNLNYEEEMLDPNKLIDYFSMFKGDTSHIHSNDFKRWAENKNSVFFQESVFAWKRNIKLKHLYLNQKVKDALNIFDYET